jgi:Cysteine rich repeat
MKHLVALLMIAFFMVPVTAMAKDNPCKEDKTKFCKDVKASGGKVGACLRQHKDEVSAECKAQLDKPKGAADADKAAKKAKPEGASPDADSSAGPSETE